MSSDKGRDPMYGLLNSDIDRQTHEILKGLFDVSQDALMMLERVDGEYLYVGSNTAHRQLTGLQPERILGRTPVEVLGDLKGTKLEEYCCMCLQSGAPIHFEDHLTFGQLQKTIVTKLTPVRTGLRDLIVGSRIDMTPLDILEREKDRLLDRYSAMFNRHAAPMLLLDPQTGRIVDGNTAAAEFYGYTLGELRVMNIKDINMLPAAEVDAQRALAANDHRRHFEFPHRLKNGEIRHVDVYSSPIDTEKGRFLYSIIVDVTDREIARQQLHREKELLNITLNSIGDGVITTDIHGCITGLNAAAQEISGWTLEEVAGRRFSEVFIMLSEQSGAAATDIVSEVLATGEVKTLDDALALVTRQGRCVPIADSAAPIRNRDGDLHGAVMVFRDVSDAREKRDRIVYLSYHDPLTGLHNRRAFDEEIARVVSNRAYPLAVIMGDVDGLKMINDVYGHDAGDRLLKSVADILAAKSTTEDAVFRWGGDEFVVLLPQTDTAAAENYIRAVKRVMAESAVGEGIQISASFGCARVQDADMPVSHALKQAEEAMYRIKLSESHSFRNGIINATLATLYEKSTETIAHADRLKEQCLRIGAEMGIGAAAMGELTVFAQLHDIGKVGIDRHVLQKPGKLSEAEWVEMKKHPEVGYRIARSIPELAPVAEYILYHHERWDGAGYPHRLRGADIPLPCRILAVADAFDAMVNDRVYRKALTEPEALEELRRNAGTQFDPAVVEIFLRIHKY